MSGTCQGVIIVTGPSATGSIKFVSVPPNAEIFIDGVDQGVKTPFTAPGIPAGPHSITVKFAGYKDASESVTVAAGSTEQVFINMTAISRPGKTGIGTILGLGLLSAGVIAAVVYSTREKKYSPPKGR